MAMFDSLPAFIRMFFVMMVIVVGYGYLIVSMITLRRLDVVLQLLFLTALSALSSFLTFRTDSMWTGEPEIFLALLTGMFTATVLFYMVKVLVRAVAGG